MKVLLTSSCFLFISLSSFTKMGHTLNFMILTFLYFQVSSSNSCDVHSEIRTGAGLFTHVGPLMSQTTVKTK